MVRQKDAGLRKSYYDREIRGLRYFQQSGNALIYRLKWEHLLEEDHVADKEGKYRVALRWMTD